MDDHDPRGDVIVGVDTHQDIHVAVALNGLGQRLAAVTIAANERGYRRLIAWMRALGNVHAVGVEGTASYGAGLTRSLHTAGVVVVEVNRPNRQRRRLHGKSDTIDAETAARTVLAGEATAQPKSADGAVEMIRVLRIARRSASTHRTMAINQMRAIVVTAPDELRRTLRKMSSATLVATAARFRPGEVTDPLAAVKFSLRSLAQRVRQLDAEIAALDEHLETLVRKAASSLLAIRGVGVQTAATLLVAAGDNPQRMRTERAFARLAGVAPVEASSGTPRTPPTQSSRQPRAQLGAAPHRRQPPGLRPQIPPLPRQTHRHRQDPPRRHPLPQALPRPRTVPPRPRRHHHT